MPTPRSEIQRYLRSGAHDPVAAAWPGDVIARVQRAHRELRGALCAEVRRRAEAVAAPPAPPEVDLVAITRARVTPMVRGLFPGPEQTVVLAALERSVVVVSSANVFEILRRITWPSSAWSVANLYLVSIDAAPLARSAPQIDGMSEETTCYVSAAHLLGDDPFTDFVLHEAAHVFHNCKRATLGLPETRRREWLLDIDFRKRETFAYACEALGCVLRQADRPRARAAALARLLERWIPGDEQVDPAEYQDILSQAVASRNGWRVIEQRCAPPRPRRAEGPSRSAPGRSGPGASG